jgi:hypothetical protein
MDLRDLVVVAVRARTPVDDRERSCIEQFLTEIAQLDGDPFDEHAGSVHVTVSALIVGPRGVVLHRHRILGTWVAPGGHIDPGETPWDAVVREAPRGDRANVRHLDAREPSPN